MEPEESEVNRLRARKKSQTRAWRQAAIATYGLACHKCSWSVGRLPLHSLKKNCRKISETTMSRRLQHQGHSMCEQHMPSWFKEGNSSAAVHNIHDTPSFMTRGMQQAQADLLKFSHP